MTQSYGKLAKDLLVKHIEDDLKDVKQVFVTSSTKISSNNVAQLRKKLRGVKTKYRVVKNSLLTRIISKSDMKGLVDGIDGQCGLGISEGDVSSVSKVLTEFKSENETFQINNLYYEGNIYGSKDIEHFSKLPSRPELLAKVCAGLQSPIYKTVNVLQGVMRNFAYVLEAIKSKKS